MKNSQLAVDILLAEDEPVNAKLIVTLLSRWGYTFHATENGEKALHYYKENGAKIILMDMQMPVMNGFDATIAIRNFEEEKKTSSPVPIIALTGYTQPRELNQCLEAGVNATLEKPIHVQKLHDILKQFLNSHS